MSRVKSLALWLIPIGIFYWIWHNLDLEVLKKHLELVNPWLVGFGVVFSPLGIVVAAFRWRRLLVPHLSGSVELSFLLKHFWISMTLGITGTPIGGDVYRAIMAGRQYGRTVLNIVVVLAEKVIALSACLLLIILLYPFVTVPSVPEITRVAQVAWIAATLILTSFVVISAGLLPNHMPGLTLIIRRVRNSVRSMLRKARISDTALQNEESITNLIALAKIICAPSSLLINVFLSVLTALAAAVGNYLFFLATEFEISFVANFFVVAMLFVVVSLPLSFIGIREGAYVVFYGFFGVPVETALLVSFFSTTGLLLNVLIGGSFVLHARLRRSHSGS